MLHALPVVLCVLGIENVSQLLTALAADVAPIMRPVMPDGRHWDHPVDYADAHNGTGACISYIASICLVDSLTGLPDATS